MAEPNETTEETNLEEPQSPSDLAADVDDMLDDEFTPEPDPALEEGAAALEGKEEAEKLAAEAKEKKPEEEAEEKPAEEGAEEEEIRLKPAEEKVDEEAAPQTYKIGDQEFTLAEVSAPDFVSKLVTMANQFPHIQKKYTDLLEQAQAAPPPAAPAQPEQVVTAAAVQAAMRPHIEKQVQDGFIDEDLPTMFPAAAAGMMRMKLMQEKMIEVITGLVERGNTSQARDESTEFHHSMQSYIEEIAGGEDTQLYGELAKPEMQEKFLKYLMESVDPRPEYANNKEFLKRQWMSFLGPDVFNSTIATIKEKAEADAARKFVGGENGSTRAAKTPTVEGMAGEVADMLSGFDR